MKIRCGMFNVFADFTIIKKVKGCDILIAASMIDRSEQLLRSVVASFCKSSGLSYALEVDGNKFSLREQGEKYRSYINTTKAAFDRISHAVMYCLDFKEHFLITRKDENFTYERFYDHLMSKFTLPLLREWAKPIWEQAASENRITRTTVYAVPESLEKEIKLYGSKVKIKDIACFEINISMKWLSDIVSKLLKTKMIQITNEEQDKLNLKDMDAYFSEYGKSIIENLKESVNPLTELSGEVKNLALKSKRLFPQQAAVVNGLVKYHEGKKCSIVNGGMGTGKTLQGASVIESYFVEKYLKMSKNESLKDIYEDSTKIKYRTVIMCPGHLVEKWESECREIPYAKTRIINSLDDLIEINKKIEKEREFYIIGKDFCKLSYSYMPVPYKIGKRKAPIVICRNCGTHGSFQDIKKRIKCNCGKLDWKFHDDAESEKIEGLLCPSCNQVLAYKNGQAMQPHDFSDKTDSNDECMYCGNKLWMPDVKLHGNIKDSRWVKYTHYSNMTKRVRKTAWVLKGYEREYMIQKNVPDGLFTLTPRKQSRKYAPASYIKKRMKGFFDFCILDELHTYKGSDTAQGLAMHALIKSSKKCMGLTGTIAGGMASHLFYILYRMDPAGMKKKNYEYSDVLKFSEDYGTIETEYEYKSCESTHNSSSRGKKISQPRVKPGISPLIFSDFLIDKTVFLDITDMSGHLPKLVEEVVSVPMDDKMRREYHRVINSLKGNGNGLNPLSSAMLQFSLAYPDKPYGYGPIVHPKSGAVAAHPRDFDIKDALLAKEEALVEIVNRELSEERNMFIYAEFTNDGRMKVTERIQQILEIHCGLEGKVQILESMSPEASKREEWIHIKASEGKKVFICNPRNVETGLDFIFDYKGVLYNFPTLVFYQLGVNLFTLWQASRRGYRLNQILECRTFYMCYKGTSQEKVVKLMAEKQVATSAIQGKFSAEGLAAMASGIDPRIALLNTLINDEYSVDESEAISKMFKNLNVKGNDDAVYGSKRTKLLKEIIGEASIKSEHNNSFMQAVISQIVKKEDKAVDNKEECSKKIITFYDLFNVDVNQFKTAPVKRRNKNKEVMKIAVGQTTIFDF